METTLLWVTMETDSKSSVLSQVMICLKKVSVNCSCGFFFLSSLGFTCISGEMVWSTRNLNVSVPSLLWVVVDKDQTQPELLVSGGSDKCLRIWKREGDGEETMVDLTMLRMLAAHGVVLTMAQNSTYMATASGEGH